MNEIFFIDIYSPIKTISHQPINPEINRPTKRAKNQASKAISQSMPYAVLTSLPSLPSLPSDQNIWIKFGQAPGSPEDRLGTGGVKCWKSWALVLCVRSGCQVCIELQRRHVSGRQEDFSDVHVRITYSVITALAVRNHFLATDVILEQLVGLEITGFDLIWDSRACWGKFVVCWSERELPARVRTGNGQNFEESISVMPFHISLSPFTKTVGFQPEVESLTMSTAFSHPVHFAQKTY